MNTAFLPKKKKILSQKLKFNCISLDVSLLLSTLKIYQIFFFIHCEVQYFPHCRLKCFSLEGTFSSTV